MSEASNHKQFIFNEKIDKDLLISLYEDDYAYMEEIFSITLGQLKPDIEILKKSFENNDLAGVKKCTHKIKPSFGFVGLPQTQELCKQFEDACGSTESASELVSQYTQLYNRLEESIHIIETEHGKLKEFNL